MPAADEIPSNSSKAIDGNLDLCLHNCLLLSRVCCLPKQKKTATQSISLVVASITLELYYGSSSQLAFLVQGMQGMDRRNQKSLVLGKYEHTTAVCAATLRAKSSELLPKVTHELVLLNPEKLEKPLETAT
jgi:hypothetical protein